MTNLPTWGGICRNTIDDLNEARSKLSDAASWLRSDWRPVDTALTGGAGDARSEAFDAIGDMKARIDTVKQALRDVADNPTR